MKIEKGSFVINRYDIKSITELLNGRNEVEYDGCIGVVEDICGRTGESIVTVNYQGEKRKGHLNNLILVKCELEK